MKVWIDQSACNGNGVCEQIAPDVFVVEKGLAYVREGTTVYAAHRGNAEGIEGQAAVPPAWEEAVLDAAEECPMECIFVEP